MRRSVLVGMAVIGAWSCASVPTILPPAFHIEDIPAEVATRLSLNDRIVAADAWSALKAGRAEQARKLLLKMGPASPVCAVGLAYVSLLRADIGGAEDGFKRALEAEPGMTAARAGLAQIFESRGEKDKVFNEFREILKRDPGNRWAKPRFEALRDELVGAARAEARAAQAAGNAEGAKRAFLTLLFYDPADGAAHLELARLYRREKDAASAGLHFRAAMAGRPPDREALREFAEFLADSGELGQSLEVFEKLRELDLRNEEALRRIAELKAKLGIYELPSQYADIPAEEAIAREDLAALIGVKFESLLEAPGPRTEILVDISLSWAQRYIVKVASLEIMSVYDNHTFQPRRVINRADLADTAVRLIAVLQARGSRFVPIVEARRIQVADVAPDNYYFPAVIRALSFQVMSLTPGKLFEPERTVSGREAIRVLDLILNLAR